MAAGADDIEPKAKAAEAALSFTKRKLERRIPISQSESSVFFHPDSSLITPPISTAKGKQEAPQELENPPLDIADSNAVIAEMNKIASAIPRQRPSPPKPQNKSTPPEEENFLEKGKALFKQVTTPKKKKEEKARKRQQAEVLYTGWVTEQERIKTKQTEAKGKLITLLWDAFVVRSHDFINNPDIQKDVYGLIVAYYEALAKILFKKGSGSIRGQLHKKDSDIALSFLKEKMEIEEDNFHLFRIMVSYADTLDYDEAAGWLRQDNSLSKLLFSNDFWPSNISDDDKIQRIISTLKVIFSGEKAKEIFIHLHLCGKKSGIKNHNLTNPREKKKLSITDAEKTFTEGLKNTLTVILAPFVQESFALTKEEEAQKKEKEQQGGKIANWFHSLLIYSIAKLSEEIPHSDKKIIYIRKEDRDLRFCVYRPDEPLEEKVIPGFFGIDFDEEVLENLLNEESVEKEPEKRRLVIELKNAILKRLAQEGFAPSLFYYPDLESPDKTESESSSLSSTSTLGKKDEEVIEDSTKDFSGGFSSSIASSRKDIGSSISIGTSRRGEITADDLTEGETEEDDDRPTTPLLPSEPDDKPLTPPQTPLDNPSFMPPSADDRILWQLDLNSNDNIGTPCEPDSPIRLESKIESFGMHAEPNSPTKKDREKEKSTSSLPQPLRELIQSLSSVRITPLSRSKGSEKKDRKKPSSVFDTRTSIDSTTDRVLSKEIPGFFGSSSEPPPSSPLPVTKQHRTTASSVAPFKKTRDYLLAYVWSKEESEHQMAAKSILTAYEKKKKSVEKEANPFKGFPSEYSEKEGESVNVIRINDDEINNRIVFTDSRETQITFAENKETNSTEVEVFGEYDEAIKATVSAAQKLCAVSGNKVFVFDLDLTAAQADEKNRSQLEADYCAALFAKDIVPIFDRYENENDESYKTAAWRTYKDLRNIGDDINLQYLDKMLKCNDKVLHGEFVDALLSEFASEKFIEDSEGILRNKEYLLSIKNAAELKDIIEVQFEKKDLAEAGSHFDEETILPPVEPISPLTEEELDQLKTASSNTFFLSASGSPPPTKPLSPHSCSTPGKSPGKGNH